MVFWTCVFGVSCEVEILVRWVVAFVLVDVFICDCWVFYVTFRICFRRGNGRFPVIGWLRNPFRLSAFLHTVMHVGCSLRVGLFSTACIRACTRSTSCATT